MNLKSPPIIAALALSPVAANATCYRERLFGLWKSPETRHDRVSGEGPAVGGWVPNWVQVDRLRSQHAHPGPWDCKMRRSGSFSLQRRVNGLVCRAQWRVAGR